VQKSTITELYDLRREANLTPLLPGKRTKGNHLENTFVDREPISRRKRARIWGENTGNDFGKTGLKGEWATRHQKGEEDGC